MKKLLPIKYPMITSWPWIAGSFSVLENNEYCLPWIYSNFIQLFCEIYSARISLHFLPHIDVFSVCPFFHTCLLPRKIIKQDNQTIVNFIKNCINNNIYVYGVVDEGVFFNNGKLTHEILICGYDDLKKQLIVADFTFNKSKKYSFATVLYAQFEKAYANIKEEDDDLTDGLGGYGGLLLFSLNEYNSYPVNLQLIKGSLQDFLQGIDSGANYRTYDIRNDRKLHGLCNLKYGIQIYDELARFFKSVQSGEKQYMRQPLHILYDHKLLMVKRLKFLRQTCCMKGLDSIICGYTELEKQVQILRNLSLKQWIKSQTVDGERIEEKLNEIRNEEQLLVFNLLNIL